MKPGCLDEIVGHFGWATAAVIAVIVSAWALLDYADGVLQHRWAKALVEECADADNDTAIRAGLDEKVEGD